MKPATILTRVLVTTILLIAVYPCPLLAGIRPSFSLDHSLAKATHIVLATEGEVIDGRFTVIESWKGDLKPGEAVVLPDLAELADEDARQVKWYGRVDPEERYVKTVSGSQMVLFLVAPENEDQASTQDSEPTEWLPASYLGHGGFKTSVMWFERGDAYAFTQIMNPGPTELLHTGVAIQTKARITAFCVIEADLEVAIREKDPIRASQALFAFYREGFWAGASEGIDSLGRMGEVALPTFRRLLKDKQLGQWHPRLISSMAEVGGIEVADDLTAIAEEGLTFWQTKAATLEKGWWNRDFEDKRWLRSEYSRLLASLRALETLRHEPCRDVVLAIRELWQSHQAMSDVGDNQMAQACDKVLDALEN